MRALRLLAARLALLRFLHSAIPFIACVPALCSSLGIRTLLPMGQGLLGAVTLLPLPKARRQRDLPSSWATLFRICPVLRPRRNFYVRPFDVSVLPPHFQLQRLPQYNLAFEAQLHGFYDRCLRFTAMVTHSHARLASGCRPGFTGLDWLPTGSLRKVSASVRPPFPSFAWRDGNRG